MPLSTVLSHVGWRSDRVQAGATMWKMTLLVFTLSLASCSKPSQPPNETARIDCGLLPSDFISTLDKDWWQNLPPVVDFVTNVVSIDKAGNFKWNGTNIEGQRLDEYLKVTSQMNPIFPTSIEFSAGTPCTSIMKVRALMRKYLSCSQHQKCFQGKWPAF